ncbi:MAG TPA: rhomboid family intramembrane serine protease [Mucilaginibacter sp.]|nr:rhomboid family intramembrane serine protease [Mucilaginibacter sp.]
MKEYGKKFRLIFLPFALINVVLVIAYTFLRWALFIKMTLFTVDLDILDLWGPMVLPWIPILIWLRPRIKLLNLKNKNGKGDPLMGYMAFAWMAMFAPLAIAQAYIETATGKLTQLENISLVNKQPLTKYYKIKHFYIDKKLCGYKTRFEISGKYNQDFDMYIYVAVPVYDTDHIIKKYNYTISAPKSPINSNNALIVVNGKITDRDYLHSVNPRSIDKITVLKGRTGEALYGNAGKNGAILITTKQGRFTDTLESIQEDNAKYTPFAWIGVKYQKTVSSRLSSDEKQQRYQQFATQSQAAFDSADLNKFIYLDRISYSSDFKGYISAVKKDPFYSSLNTSPPIIFTTVNEPFEARNGHKLLWVFGAMGIGFTFFLITLLFKPLRRNTESIDIEGEAQADQKTFFVWAKALIIPQKRLAVTQVLIQINLLVFMLMVFSGLGFMSFNGADLLRLGANYRPAIHKGEYWRLLTNIFLHGGVMHVLMNMYGLFFVGLFLEPVMGRVKYLITYLVCGIAASIASAWWHPATISIGASGAIFGLFGAFLALLTVNVFPATSKKSFLISTSIFIGYNLLFGLVGGIDNAAHIGGLISGLILGYALYPSLKNTTIQKHADAGTEEIIPGAEPEQDYQSEE